MAMITDPAGPSDALLCPAPAEPPLRSPDLCARLSGRVSQALASVAAGRRRHVLLDYPSHWNIGDSAIWQGETEALRRLHGQPPDHVSHVRYPVKHVADGLPADGEPGLIYLHGGGNFGDIWPHYQRHREAVLNMYPGHRVVQLPQSLHFSDAAAIEPTKRAIGGHPDFHLMVRDHASFDFARAQFDCNVLLAPDAAFCIDRTGFDRAPAPEGIGCIFRDDKERRDDADTAVALFGPAGREDWRRHGDLRRTGERALMGFGMLGGQRITGPLLPRAFDVMARARVAMGMAQIDRHAVLVTDRLHGHIMATLLGKPHVVIDNFYGKIANFITAWGADDITLRAADFAEAHAMAQGLAQDAARLQVVPGAPPACATPDPVV